MEREREFLRSLSRSRSRSRSLSLSRCSRSRDRLRDRERLRLRLLLLVFERYRRLLIRFGFTGSNKIGVGDLDFSRIPCSISSSLIFFAAFLTL